MNQRHVDRSAGSLLFLYGADRKRGIHRDRESTACPVGPFILVASLKRCSLSLQDILEDVLCSPARSILHTVLQPLFSLYTPDFLSNTSCRILHIHTASSGLADPKVQTDPKWTMRGPTCRKGCLKGCGATFRKSSHRKSVSFSQYRYQ